MIKSLLYHGQTRYYVFKFWHDDTWLLDTRSNAVHLIRVGGAAAFRIYCYLILYNIDNLPGSLEIRNHIVFLPTLCSLTMKYLTPIHLQTPFLSTNSGSDKIPIFKMMESGQINKKIYLYLKYLVIDNNFACGEAEQGVSKCKTFSRM